MASIIELYRDQCDAKFHYPVGTFIRHNASGKVYEVVAHGIDEEFEEATIGYKAAPVLDNKLMVRSRHDSEGDVIFFRRITKFGETVRWNDDDRHLGPRFTTVKPCLTYSE